MLDSGLGVGVLFPDRRLMEKWQTLLPSGLRAKACGWGRPGAVQVQATEGPDFDGVDLSLGFFCAEDQIGAHQSVVTPACHRLLNMLRLKPHFHHPPGHPGVHVLT